jgi:hypothetical protein
VKTAHRSRSALVALLITTTALALTGLAATAALADSGGMAGMPGMTQDQMQNMATPTPAPSATAMSGSSTSSAGSMGSGAASSAGSMSAGGVQQGRLAPAMAPDMVMDKGSVNWAVIGGFAALVAGATLAAAATKRHLRRRMAAGELATAGVQSV